LALFNINPLCYSDLLKLLAHTVATKVLGQLSHTRLNVTALRYQDMRQDMSTQGSL